MLVENLSHSTIAKPRPRHRLDFFLLLFLSLLLCDPFFQIPPQAQTGLSTILSQVLPHSKPVANPSKKVPNWSVCNHLLNAHFYLKPNKGINLCHIS
jgi:hypothetical protein